MEFPQFHQTLCPILHSAERAESNTVLTLKTPCTINLTRNVPEPHFSSSYSRLMIPTPLIALSTSAAELRKIYSRVIIVDVGAGGRGTVESDDGWGATDAWIIGTRFVCVGRGGGEVRCGLWANLTELRQRWTCAD